MTALASPAPALAEAPTKRGWHATTALHVRRRVLLQILLLLKTKYGKVDAKISYIARRAELALYTQAFSLDEYRNPKTLNRRLHSLVVKLHMNNLAAREDQIFDVEGDGGSASMDETHASASAAPQPPKRALAESPCSQSIRSMHKRPRTSSVDAVTHESAICFDGNRDLLQQVCSFLSAAGALRLASTSRNMHAIIPLFVTTVQVSVRTLETLSPSTRTSFFDRFANLEHFEVHGDEQSHLHFDFQNELALVRRNVVCRSLLVALARQPLSRLKCVRWHFAFVDGVHDRITNQIAEVLLDPGKFPRLVELSLVGNAVSDDGVAFLCKSLRRFQCRTSIQTLNLEQNFVGERGRRELEQLEGDRELYNSAKLIIVKLKGNLLTSAPLSR